MQYERYSQEWAIIHSYRPEVRNSPLLVSLRGGERRITRFGHHGRVATLFLRKQRKTRLVRSKSDVLPPPITALLFVE